MGTNSDSSKTQYYGATSSSAQLAAASTSAISGAASALLAAASTAALSEDEPTWLNQLIHEVWPYQANITQFIILEYVQPALIAAMPAGLPAPKFSKIDIGTSSPKIKRISVRKRRFAPNDIAAVIEAEVELETTEMDVRMKLAEFSFGVDRLKLQGTVEVVIRPFLNRVPLIGAVQVAFINKPFVEYNLTGLAAVGNQSIIKSVVRKVSNTVLGEIAVLPNRVTQKADDTIDYFTLSTQPLGVLRVAILSGKGFPLTDQDVFKQAVGLSAAPDVYFTVKHGNVTFQTERVDDSTDPEYENQIFDFVLTSDSKTQELRVKAFDYDIGINNDDYLGKASPLVTDIVQKGIADIDLLDSPDDATPSVKLAAKWLSISSDLRHVQHAIMTQRSDTLRPKTCSALLLSIDVDEAHNLPPNKRPYVRVQVGPHTHHTSAAYDLDGMSSVEDPEFEQSFHIGLQGAADASVKVEFSIFNLGTSELLGYAFCSLSEAVEAGPAGKIYNFALMKAQRPNATLRVRTKLAAVLDQPALWEVLAKSSKDAKPKKA